MGSLGEKKPVSLHIWFTKKPGMSYADFHEYWTQVHGKRFLEMDIVKKHCLRYEQVSPDSSLPCLACQISLPPTSSSHMTSGVFSQG